MSTTEKPRSLNGRPVQILSWKEKDEQWFKDNIEYYIGRAGFLAPNQAMGKDTRDIGLLYEVYNNKFPMAWFKHVTDPLSAKDSKHKAFPAKIRPVNILRTNIDLLLGEYPRRPFIYNVENLGDSGYNRYTEGMRATAEQTMTEIFIRSAIEEMAASGQPVTEEMMEKLQSDPPVPAEIKEKFKLSFKDQIAIKGQKWLRRIIREEEIRAKLHRGFKDWLIAGEVCTYKAIENEKLVYRKLSPRQIAYDKTESEDYLEDGEWVVYRDYLTMSTLVDRFYEDLKEQHHKDLEAQYQYGSPKKFHEHLGTIYKDSASRDKIPVYHVQFKGRKKIGFLSYLDMETFQLVEDIVDENYIVDRDKGEQVEWRWVNEVYEGWRLGDTVGEKGLYVNMRACPIQRNEMNNHSTCKLSYNGRRYSDTEAENISVLEMGIPFQILYIIITYILEKTIAKSKGKILMMDQKTIPTEGGWTEEKFFYYAESLGYALLDRSQIGVDKTWNQYQVLDLSLFDQIKQLIEMQQHLKQEWDDIIGITRQRKGQTYSSDGQGVNERAVFQSTVITDMIFLGFEEFTQRELQGLLDYSKFLTSKGLYGTWNDDELGTQITEIFPEDFMNEELGIFMSSASEAMRKLDEMKGYAQAMIQNAAKPSTVLEVIDAINVAELKGRLREIEAIQERIDQQAALNEQDAQAAADERQKMFMEFEKMLDREHMDAEYDRKEDLEMIKGTFNTFTFQDGDANANGIPDAAEAMKLLQNSQKIEFDYQDKLAKRQTERENLALKKKALEHQINDSKIKNKQADKKLKIDAKKAAQRPKATKK